MREVAGWKSKNVSIIENENNETELERGLLALFADNRPE